MGCSAPKIAIVPFPKYSHGFPIHCHDRFGRGEDDERAENKEDTMIPVLFVKLEDDEQCSLNMRKDDDDDDDDDYDYNKYDNK